jgi:hypothetical protein
MSEKGSRVYGYGSNVDIGSPHEVFADLLEREQQVDMATEDFRASCEDFADAEATHTREYALRYAEIAQVEDKITKAKEDAKVATADEKAALENARTMKEFYLEQLRSKRAILSSVQSRASMVKQQMEMEVTTTS